MDAEDKARRTRDAIAQMIEFRNRHKELDVALRLLEDERRSNVKFVSGLANQVVITQKDYERVMKWFDDSWTLLQTFTRAAYVYKDAMKQMEPFCTFEGRVELEKRLDLMYVVFATGDRYAGPVVTISTAEPEEGQKRGPPQDPSTN